MYVNPRGAEGAGCDSRACSPAAQWLSPHMYLQVPAGTAIGMHGCEVDHKYLKHCCLCTKRCRQAGPCFHVCLQDLLKGLQLQRGALGCLAE
jgi:hypothetical protein